MNSCKYIETVKRNNSLIFPKSQFHTKFLDGIDYRLVVTRVLLFFMPHSEIIMLIILDIICKIPLLTIDQTLYIQSLKLPLKLPL